MRLTRNQVWGYTQRGFESPPLRRPANLSHPKAARGSVAGALVTPSTNIRARNRAGHRSGPLTQTCVIMGIP